MGFIKNLMYKLFKKKSSVKKPWLEYYSREDRTIKFTDKTIYEYMRDEVGEDLDFIALNYFGAKMTYFDLFDKIDLAARSLRSMGVKPKDVVTICMPNTPEAIITFYAINKIGAIADMVHPLSSEEEIKQYLNDSKSRYLFLLDSNYSKYKDILEDTLVYKTIYISPSESMSKAMKIGYFFTRGIKIKRPRLGDIDFLTWKEFLFQ